MKIRYIISLCSIAVFFYSNNCFAQQINIIPKVEFGKSFLSSLEGPSKASINGSENIKTRNENGYRIKWGLASRFNFKTYYIQPEITFNLNHLKIKNYRDNSILSTLRPFGIDMPILLGKSFVHGVIRLEGGIVLSFLSLNPNIHHNSEEIIELKQPINTGYQIGFGTNFKRFEIDIKYENVPLVWVVNGFNSRSAMQTVLCSVGYKIR